MVARERGFLGISGNSTHMECAFHIALHRAVDYLAVEDAANEDTRVVGALHAATGSHFHIQVLYVARRVVGEESVVAVVGISPKSGNGVSVAVDVGSHGAVAANCRPTRGGGVLANPSGEVDVVHYLEVTRIACALQVFGRVDEIGVVLLSASGIFHRGCGQVRWSKTLSLGVELHLCAALQRFGCKSPAVAIASGFNSITVAIVEIYHSTINAVSTNLGGLAHEARSNHRRSCLIFLVGVALRLENVPVIVEVPAPRHIVGFELEHRLPHA